MNTTALSYIPQRAPFFMIDDVVFAEGNITRTTLAIKEDNLFVSEGHFTEPGLIENMAQTAGAGTGYRAIQDNKPMPMGYIAALKNINIFSLPAVNEIITTESVFLQAMLNFHLVKASVMVGDKEIANCEFKIFVTPDTSEKSIGKGVV
jgi:predicted hotdog family 3-hydroxylacyl-ACP dehydratase